MPVSANSDRPPKGGSASAGEFARVLKRRALNTGLPKRREELFEPLYKISRASKTALLRSAPPFADTSAYGRGEAAAFLYGVP